MHMMLYRGSLKSCNYDCSYCPFSKHSAGEEELAQDRDQWLSFVQDYRTRSERLGIRALMLTPYGEALIHPWYWEGLAQISALPWTEAVGAQTNLSFAAAKQLELFEANGGILEKLRLWATFHPQMTTVTAFAGVCGQLAAKGIRMCAGAVGVPEHIELFRQLRKELPQEIYLWVNRMDGLGRPYTEQEVRAFSDIDPYFYRELVWHPANAAECEGRYFVEAGKGMRLCNLSMGVSCKRKRCSCYLAYGGRKQLVNDLLFGPWPLFRIPRRPRAAFLDIEGTLLPMQAELFQALEVLAVRERTLLFFATTLPFAEAARRCRGFWHLFAGGVFAGGAHMLVKETASTERRECFHLLPEGCVLYLEQLCRMFFCRMLAYRNGAGDCYKITLLRTRRRPWDCFEAEKLMKRLPQEYQLRYMIEGHCMQLVAAGADKETGVKKICGWLGLLPKECFAAGDSSEDAGMVKWITASFT